MGRKLTFKEQTPEQLSVTSMEGQCQSRYDLSLDSCRTLQRDYIRFRQECCDAFDTRFICKILLHYLQYAYDNTHVLTMMKKEISVLFDGDVENKKLKITCLGAAPDGLCQYRDGDDKRCRINRVGLNKELRKLIAQYDFIIENPNFKKSQLINYILKKYTDLSIPERELIFCYPLYKTFKDCIDNSKYLKVIYKDRHDNLSENTVRPYMLEIDENTFSYYLIAFSSENDSFEPIKLSQIIDCHSVTDTFTITPKEEERANRTVQQFGAAYANGKISSKMIIKLSLTENGLELYKMRCNTLHIKQPNNGKVMSEYKSGRKYYVLTFVDCTPELICEIFLPFKKEVKIVEPKKLRSILLRDYFDIHGSTAEDNGRIIVRLSEFGYKKLYLKAVAHQRPLPTKTPDPIIIEVNEKGELKKIVYYDLTFNCSEKQIRHYFFPYGKDALIISPKTLQDNIADEFMKACNSYRAFQNPDMPTNWDCSCGNTGISGYYCSYCGKKYEE